MGAQPQIQPSEAVPQTRPRSKTAKLEVVPRQPAFYRRKEDSRKNGVKLLDRSEVLQILARQKVNAALMPLLLHGARLSNGPAQLGYLLSVLMKTDLGYHAAGKPAAEFTPPMLDEDFAKELGLTKQALNKARRDALARGLTVRRGEKGGEYYQDKCCVEKWAELPDATHTAEDNGNEDGEDKTNVLETSVSRVSVGAGRRKRIGLIGDGETARAVEFRNETESPLDIGLTIPQDGPIEIVAEAKAASSAGNPPAKTPARTSRGRQAPVALPLEPAAAEAGEKVISPADPAPPVKVAAAAQVQETMRDARSPITLTEAREIAGILHSGPQQPLDISWFCSTVKERAAQLAQKGQSLTYPLLRTIATRSAEVWPQEAEHRKSPQKAAAPVLTDAYLRELMARDRVKK
jgi:hypothetical protein